MNIKRIVEDTDSTPGRVALFVIQGLIVLSIIAISINTIPTLDPSTKRFLWYFEVFSIGVFTLEYLVRLAVADKKLAFVFSFYGIVDLLAILPFYLALGIDLRSVRAFRFIRLFKVFQMPLFTDAIGRYRRAFLYAREELIIFGVLMLIILFLSASGIYYFENKVQPEAFSSIPQSLWWAIVTLTTVGYGDVYPITAGGKIFTFLVLFVGLGTVAVPSGIMASALTEARGEDKSSLH